MADEDKKKKSDGGKAGGSGGKSGGGPGAGGGEKKVKGKKGSGPAQLAKPVTTTPQEYVAPRMKKRYDAEVIPALTKQFGFTTRMRVPRVEKITLNMGLGEAVANGKIIDSGVTEVTAIAGQKPVVTRARKSIATFKLRQGAPIGVMVTLRRDRMWEFLDRLITFSLPRVRDFKGVSPKAFDGAGPDHRETGRHGDWAVPIAVMEERHELIAVLIPPCTGIPLEVPRVIDPPAHHASRPLMSPSRRVPASTTRRMSRIASVSSADPAAVSR